ncbi:MAG: cytochrome c maturation protein CcmE [Acidobacteria bacterium]|nr:cytochrome c maturation protein CcmE [Acidobacteriota bacterium]MBV9925275.1 cytochrome c maturation protein CcmE [Acidobacteriota bacterium]
MTADVMSATALTRRKTRWFMVGAFAVAAIAFVVIAAGGINKNLVYYWTPSDLYGAGDKAYGATIRLGGMVAKGSIHNLGGTSGVEFDVKDATRVVHVKSNGVPPQMFRENIGVVVEGTMTRGGYFESNRLMVSHGNDYKAPEKGHPVDKQELQRLMRSTEGLSNS